MFPLLHGLCQSFIILLLRIPRLGLSLLQKLSPLLYLRIIMDSMVSSKATSACIRLVRGSGFLWRRRSKQSICPCSPALRLLLLLMLYLGALPARVLEKFHLQGCCLGTNLESSRHDAFTSDLGSLIRPSSPHFGGQGPTLIFPTLTTHITLIFVGVYLCLCVGEFTILFLK